MLDNKLIELSTETAKVAITEAEKSSIQNLYSVKSIFHSDHIKKIKNYFDETSDSWTSDDHLRKLITWDFDTVVEEIHIVCNNLTQTVIDRFDFKNLNFLGIQLWKHAPGYSMPWHTDNEIINVALQIYLFDEVPEKFGTSFRDKSTVVDIPYVNNSGYVAVTKTQPGIEHFTTNQLEKNLHRCIIYAIWSTTEKHKG